MALTSLLNLAVHRANFKSRSFTVLITSSFWKGNSIREISKEKEEESVTEFANFKTTKRFGSRRRNMRQNLQELMNTLIELGLGWG